MRRVAKQPYFLAAGLAAISPGNAYTSSSQQ
jgi:hypothetical protein